VDTSWRAFLRTQAQGLLAAMHGPGVAASGAFADSSAYEVDLARAAGLRGVAQLRQACRCHSWSPPRGLSAGRPRACPLALALTALAVTMAATA